MSLFATIENYEPQRQRRDTLNSRRNAIAMIRDGAARAQSDRSAHGQLAKNMIAGGRLDPARMITKRIALSQAGSALKAMDGYTGAGVTVIDRMEA